ncbi:MAG TPA: glycosyltransferase [Solirubrobacteraceae bacterium]|nr:glycosyltransferase [Solirubrobacteraceae bacterium]
MSRPSVSVIVPCAGSAAELGDVVRRFAALPRERDDELIVVDNSAHGAAVQAPGGVRVVHAGDVASPGYARNAGAACARGEWLVFCDADTEPEGGLLESYFQPSPGDRTAILAGGVRDHPEGDSLAARLARATDAMSQQATLANPYMPYAITANVAVRRDAFEQAGGFEGTIKAGAEDADLCWRLQRAGWTLEQRPRAVVLHRNRPTMRALWRQRALHGAGADWLAHRYPGSMPRWGALALMRSSAGRLAAAARALLVARDRQRAALELAIVSGWWAYELGRRTSNEAVRRGAPAS